MKRKEKSVACELQGKVVTQFNSYIKERKAERKDQLHLKNYYYYKVINL